MTHLVIQFYNCQKAFWGKATDGEQCRAFAFTALSGMASYVSLHILETGNCLDFIYKLSSITFRVHEFVPAAILTNSAALFYSQNLKGKAAHWQITSVVMLCAYLYSSTVKGYEAKDR